MKKFIMLLTLSLTMSAFAQDATVTAPVVDPDRVELNAENVYVNNDHAVLVRTSQTPDTVKVTFQIPMSERVCNRYDTRPVLVTSTLQCGQDRVVVQVRVADVCTRQNPITHQCLRMEQRFENRVTYRTRSCYVPQQYCAEYGTAVQTSPDEVKIKFKLADLAQGEEETFSVKAQQKNYDGSNVVYEIVPMQTKVPVKVKSKGWFGTDSYVIDEE
jgi:hypothetical protein